MKFTLEHKVGTDYSTVRFENSSLPFDVWGRLIDVFEKLGGTSQEVLAVWIFPSFITSEVLQEVIHNTCFVCGGLMKDETTIISPYEIQGCAKQIKIRRCCSCGHSHT